MDAKIPYNQEAFAGPGAAAESRAGAAADRGQGAQGAGSNTNSFAAGGAKTSGGGRGFATDAQITGSGQEGSSGRTLQRFDFAAFATESPAAAADGSLGTSNSLKGWDQFRVNEEKFGVVSTFKADLSQYTTVLDKRKITKEMRQRADKIAREMEDGGVCVKDEEYNDQLAADEEDLFSGVTRGSGYQVYAPNYDEWQQTEAPSSKVENNAGAALLACLKGTSGTARSTDGDHRALVASTVQNWWRSQRSAGFNVPSEADVALVCPFSQRMFGDVSQLVTHWAAALPRALDLQGSTETPSGVASEHFGFMAQQMVWSDMVAMADLQAVLPTDGSARQGSVWDMMLTRVGKLAGPAAVAARPVHEFLAEAVKLKCWRRDQKIEHREIMEGIAAGLAIAALKNQTNTNAGATWAVPAC